MEKEETRTLQNLLSTASPGDGSWDRVLAMSQQKIHQHFYLILFVKPDRKVNHCKVFWLGETTTCFSPNSSAEKQTIEALW